MATETGGYRAGHLMTAFLLGAAAGAVVAYLVAPEMGRRSRERIRDAARSAGRAARETTGLARDCWASAVEAARSVLEDALDEGAPR